MQYSWNGQSKASAVKIICCMTILFTTLYTFTVRYNFLGTISSNNHQWLTASTVIFVENWNSDGLFQDKGLMLELPKSIENASLASRRIYPSYFPGAAFEVYLLKKLFTTVPTVLLTQVFNVINHFLISLVLAALVFFGLPDRMGLKRYGFSMIAAMAYQLHPTAMYINSMVFFADQAVLLPFSLALLFELRLRQLIKHKQLLRVIYLLQTITLLWAMATDWLTLPLLFFLLLFRICLPAENVRQKTIDFDVLQLLFVPGIVILLFILQLYSVGMLVELLQRFIHRSGLFISWDLFIKVFFVNGIGKFNFIILFFSCVYIIYSFGKDVETQAIKIIACIAILSCVLHAFLLRNHSFVHVQFAVLKFYLVFSFLSLGLIPGLISDGIAKKQDRARKLFLYTLLFLVGYLFLTTPNKGALSLFPDKKLIYANVSNWLRENSHFEDVYIGKNIVIAGRPPGAIALSRKAVHAFINPNDLLKFISSMPESAQLYGIVHPKEREHCSIKTNAIVASIESCDEPWLIFRLTPQWLSRYSECLVSNPREGVFRSKFYT